jgi:hypothetical protein
MNETGRRTPLYRSYRVKVSSLSNVSSLMDYRCVSVQLTWHPAVKNTEYNLCLGGITGLANDESGITKRINCTPQYVHYFIYSKIHKFTMWGTVCRPTASKCGSCSNAFMEATRHVPVHHERNNSI